ncbi:ABC-2 type transport system ATP-binding protein [Actinomadura pelletieri DSM 43383]|uniref:ABC-2 type transport system ATP-binding protein n=1 Tax=Actinomadura pelletieri DSM 43383 TaxID=1120940 RepID=A0A495QX82_9ACTN|nr:ABC transporter ATP-binding protein [Actinomadura pelletieri]RKS78801.1 ABC-2 type transport system ATP-binding protein [Actinomadura pelletieri DSM 43383]
MVEWAIRTENLTKRFGRVVAVDGLDLEVGRGEIFGFLGPNGAGKSTTIRLLLALARPTSGRAWIMDVPVGDVQRAHRHVGYVAGDVALWPQLTGLETLTYLGRLSGRVDVPFRDELIERLRFDPGKRARSYSKGNRQKLALIAALMTRPDVLLLDEPTSGLDPLMEAEFQALAKDAAARGQTVFLSSHILDEVQDVCDRVAILRDGRLVEVAALAELRRLAGTVLEAIVDGPVPELAGVPGVTGVEHVDGGVRVSITGSPSPALARLSACPLVRLRSHEPTLEEIFLSYYEAEK